MVTPVDDLTCFTGFDLAHLVDLQARLRGAHPFLIWSPFEGEERRWSYAEFADAVARVAGGMARRGVRPRERVIIHLDNCPESLIAWFACARLGATAVLTNARAAGEELAYFAAHSGAVAAVTQPRLFATVQAYCPGLRWIAVTETDNGAAPAHASEADLSFAALLAGSDPAPLRPADPMLPVGVQYTSGTTSRPKGVLYTHANGLWGAKIGALHAGLRDDDRFLIHLPLYHVIALSYSLLATLWAGGTAVLLPRFSASRFWDASIRHRCTWTSMVPFCVKALGEHEVPSAHFYRAWGNAFWSPQLEQRYRVSILGWWGMTEMVTHPIVGAPGKPGRALAIGRPAPEYGVAVRREDGTPAAPGEPGHLLIRGVRGLSIFAGYLDDPAATAESFDADGFFRTGDIVTAHEDGFIQFGERAKDLLKVGGENVGAAEIERVIMTVEGVREAAVVGRSHPMLQEVPVAFVVTGARGGVAEDAVIARILAVCRQALAPFKVPRAVVLVDDLPRGTIEKVSKVTLRRHADAMEGSAAAPGAGDAGQGAGGDRG